MNRQTASSKLPLARRGVSTGGAALARGVEFAAGAVMLLQWLALGAWAYSWLTSEAQGTAGMPPLGHDFRVYWTVSWITTHLGALAAFDTATLGALQHQFFPAYTETGRWLYPPTYQWLIQPLSAMPYRWAYGVYASVSVALYAAAVWHWRSQARWPWLVVMAFPGLWIAMMAGQNSVVTLLLMTVALSCSASRPLLAGVCGGLLVIKPQFAVLLPLWWVCGRQWRALLTMLLTGGVCCALTLAWEGWSLWGAFFTSVSKFNAEVVQQGGGGIWHAMPTIFAFARLHGATLPAAYALYGAVAVPSILFAAWLWATGASLSLSVAAAIMATLLSQPYLLYYELVWLIVPLLCLGAPNVGDRASAIRPPDPACSSDGLSAWLGGRLLAAIWLLPLQAYLAALWTPMGQWGVVLLPALMLMIVCRARRPALSMPA